ncbi:MAG TPA: zinc ribbon domain-containing protein [Longimicrobiales bacterium]|nr:zinc ribbon domain-containing protein [Longimicrobiales bacterium]
MPLYEYACQACGQAFEKIRKYEERNDPTPCPGCDAEEVTLALSAPGRVAMGAGAGSASFSDLPSTGGGCASGACGL